MNRDLLHALGAIAADVYHDALQRYPELLRPSAQPLDEEALVIWCILIALDDLWGPLQAAEELGQPPAPPPVQEDLPF